MVARICNGTAHRTTTTLSPAYPRAAFLLTIILVLLVRPAFAADIAGLAYVTNCSDNTVSSYDVDSATGQLRRVHDVVAGECPLSVTVHPSGKFVYVQNARSNSLSLYAVDGVTGALTAVTTIATGQGRSPGSATVHPSGKFLYVANYGSNTISVYSLDPETGVPTPVNGSPFPAGAPPGSLAVHPGGRFLYTANFDAWSISGYAINQTTGALAPIPSSPFAAGDNPRSIVVHPSGKFAYVANFGSHDLSVYQIDATTGALHEVRPRVSAGLKPGSLAVHSDFIYVANRRTHDIATYRIDSETGTLKQVQPRVMTVGWPEAIAAYPSRKAIYATSYYDEEVFVSAFTINDKTGALTPGRPVRHGKLNRQSYYAGVALSAPPTPPLAQGALRVLFGAPIAASPAPLQVALILDASNSMWGQIEGKRKIDLAKKALTSLIQDLPSNSQVALRVYGHRQPKELKDCQDSTLLVPVGPLNKTRLIEQVQAITPRGMTPLAYSLKQVLNDLGNAPGEKLVILVSDGKESCGGDPVAAVNALRAQGVDMTLEVPGGATAPPRMNRSLKPRSPTLRVWPSPSKTKTAWAWRAG
jgi:6-phosphogluconolactonase (cycloisomerase 2 family)